MYAMIGTSTALEILTHPADLSILISQPEADGGFAFTISRGPGQNFRPIIESGPFATTPEEAVKGVGSVLYAVCEAMTKQFPDPKSYVSHRLNARAGGIILSGILHAEHIQDILAALRECGEAYTYESIPDPDDMLDPLFKVQ